MICDVGLADVWDIVGVFLGYFYRIRVMAARVWGIVGVFSVVFLGYFYRMRDMAARVWGIFGGIFGTTGSLNWSLPVG